MRSLVNNDITSKRPHNQTNPMPHRQHQCKMLARRSWDVLDIACALFHEKSIKFGGKSKKNNEFSWFSKVTWEIWCVYHPPNAKCWRAVHETCWTSPVRGPPARWGTALPLRHRRPGANWNTGTPEKTPMWWLHMITYQRKSDTNPGQSSYVRKAPEVQARSANAKLK